VVWVGGKSVVTTPKSAAGSRDVAIPPHLLPAVREHLLRHGAGRDGLLFPAATNPDAHLRHATLGKVFYPAREKAGRPDLRFHDLRHTGATLAAAAGASLAELMARLGHSTVGASLRYQHAAKGRDQEIAEALSKLAEQT
jgi:integrase